MNYHDKGKPWQGGKPQHGGPRRSEISDEMANLLKRVDFVNINSELYDAIAEQCSQEVARTGSMERRNKSSQLRRFYDEIVMWDQRIRQLKEDERARVYGSQYLPLIKMLNAKAAYAESRELVDRNFVELLRRGLSQLTPEHPAAFYNFKLFMEAFMGFYKLHGPK